MASSPPPPSTTSAASQPDAAPSGPPSIISSRMTDIASEDGDEHSSAAAKTPAPSRQSQVTAEGRSRPGTSSSKTPWAPTPPSRRGPSSALGRRASVPGSVSSSGGRPASSASRTHVPSLTSHAFFRPMSSQRLQAQRSGSRPVTLTQQPSDDGKADGDSTPRQSIHSNITARASHTVQEENDERPPPSRGTEMTEQETTGRITSNTSPTHGHNATISVSESIRPLQKNSLNTKGLSLTVDKSYKNSPSLATPGKSPRSFRSSFLLPSRGEAAPQSPARSTQGREKLSSNASSPVLPTVADIPRAKPKKLGNNYEYFAGNTRFFLGGRFQNTRDRPINIATGILALIPGVLFFVFSAPWLWYNISPAIPILFAYVFYICMSSFIHASVSDPGVSFATNYMSPNLMPIDYST